MRYCFLNVSGFERERGVVVMQAISGSLPITVNLLDQQGNLLFRKEITMVGVAR